MFCSDAYLRHTKWATPGSHWPSIKTVARFSGLHGETIKNIEKAWLEKKYKKISLGEEAVLGIDEVYLEKVMGHISVVRDMDSGSVLFIGKGNRGDALKKFRKRLKFRAKHIKAVSIDMANS